MNQCGFAEYQREYQTSGHCRCVRRLKFWHCRDCDIPNVRYAHSVYLSTVKAIPWRCGDRTFLLRNIVNNVVISSGCYPSSA